MDEDPADDDPRVRELHEAMRARERAAAELRTATARLVTNPDSTDLREAVSIALIKEIVSRVQYATVLEAAGWPVPDDLLCDVAEERRPGAR
ncbi:MAG: hypothetical protein ACRDP8_13605 [Actinopolymorphaceae bacterium]